MLVVGRQAEPPHYPPRQIVLFVGFLEWWSEFAPEVHYAKTLSPTLTPTLTPALTLTLMLTLTLCS